jgi:hypothetical protein
MQHEEMFQKAIESVGSDYLDAETKLREAGAAAAPLIDDRSKRPDATGQLLAEVLRQSLEPEGAARHRAALEYLDGVGPYFAPTPLGKPPPVGVANYLHKHFEDAVGELLTLRLIKAQDWPRWREMGVLLYLERCPGARHPLIALPLIRFAARAPPELRAQAVKTLAKQAHPALRLLLERERKAQPDWPADLAALERSLD